MVRQTKQPDWLDKADDEVRNVFGAIEVGLEKLGNGPQVREIAFLRQLTAHQIGQLVDLLLVHPQRIERPEDPDCRFVLGISSRHPSLEDGAVDYKKISIGRKVANETGNPGIRRFYFK